MADDFASLIVGDLSDVIGPREVLLLGEFHGTAELPALAGEIVSYAAEHELWVTLGLEIACSEQSNIDAVMADPTQAIAGPWWSRSPEFLDGRSSTAMAGLVQHAAALSRDGADIEVVALDGPWVAPGSPVPIELLQELELDRDQMMATRLLDVMDRRPRAFTLALAGKEHTCLTQRTAGLPRPFGYYVRSWHRGLVSLAAQSSGGTAWVLAGEPLWGRVVELDGLDLPPGAQWTNEPGAEGHHGYVHVGPVTASMPHQS